MTAVRPPPSQPQLHWSGLFRSGAGATWEGLEGSARVRLTHSGRGAIYQYFAGLRQSGNPKGSRRVVLVPAFHCPTVVDPILHAGYEVRFYAIDADMRIDVEDFLRKLDAGVAAAVFIRFFGFAETDLRLVAACRTAGARIVEDCCHSFLSANPVRLAHSGADATMYSFWKLAPSLVGGGVLLNAYEQAPTLPPQAAPSARDSKARMKQLGRQLLERPLDLAARVLKRGSHNATALASPAIRKPADQAYPYDRAASSWRMPRSAKRILACADLEHIVGARRRNYQRLASALRPTPHLSVMRRSLAEDTCPWGLPVLLHKRAERDYMIRSRGVPLFTFGEVLHPLLFSQHVSERAMLESARFLSDTMLVFAIHQELSETQLERFAAEINSYVATL